MSLQGIFITKQGVSIPVVTQMSLAQLAGYQENLTLPLVKGSSFDFNAFEFFKFRGIINENVPAEFVFNGAINYTPTFVTGSGSLDVSNGRITPTSTPLGVEKANTVYLTGAILGGHQLVDGDDIKLRIASIAGSSYRQFNIDAHTINSVIENTAIPSPPSTDSYTEPANATIEIEEDSLLFKVAGVTVYTIARTWRANVDAAVGTIGGTNTSGAVAFSDTVTLDVANTEGATGAITILNEFFDTGNTTVYAVSVGTPLTTSNSTELLEKDTPETGINFNAGQAASYDTSDDFLNGVGAVTYHVSNGILPAGVHLTTEGLLTGIPVTDGQESVTIQSIDALGNIANVVYLITVKESANVNYNPQPAIQGVAYSFNPQLAGITGAAVTAGIVPAGLTLNPSTGALTGTPSVVQSYSFTVRLTFDSHTEDVEVILPVYAPLTIEGFSQGASIGVLAPNQNSPIQGNADNSIHVTGGSGQYQYSITGGNFINSQGQMQIFQTGEVSVTVVDIVTGQVFITTFLVSGQTDTCGMAIEEEDSTINDSAPCTEIITDCDNPITIAFQSMQILRGLQPTEIPYREYPNFVEMEGATVDNNGKPFVLFRSKSDNGWAIADNGRDGQALIVEALVDASVANSAYDFFIGIAKNFQNHVVTELDFACVITTVNAVRSVEIRKSNVYQSGSRVPILEGQQVGFAVFPDSVILYIDGLASYTLSSKTFACTGVDLVFYAAKANMLCGGKANNLVFDIATSGSPDDVGIIDTQSGLYTPSQTNIGLIVIEATSVNNANVQYKAKVRVISGAPRTSLEHAMIEGIPVDLWICDTERQDDMPLRLTRDGKPDRNQVSNPKHLGTLQGSAKMDAAVTRQDFRNDRGATSSSLVIDKVNIAGGFLAVRDMPLVKKLVPFMKEQNRAGVRSLQQYSSGCHKRIRLIMVWQTADCSDVPVFDAIEFNSALSYTMFNLEVGQGVQSNIPLSIEAFPDGGTGVIYEYNQYDKHFQRIGASS